jgi:hypothetical protein
LIHEALPQICWLMVRRRSLAGGVRPLNLGRDYFAILDQLGRRRPSSFCQRRAMLIKEHQVIAINMDWRPRAGGIVNRFEGLGCSDG